MYRFGRLLAIGTASIFAPLWIGCEASVEPTQESLGSPSMLPRDEARAEVEASQFTILKRVAHGRIEDHAGLRLVRLWGSPQERGRAHGLLLAPEIAGLVRRELLARFSSRKELLARARMTLPLLVGYPTDYGAEIDAMFAAIEERSVDLALPGFDRAIDRRDVLLVNAMDLLVQIGCSGFTVSGDQVEGGGVLTARNFDWRLTGPYLIEDSCLIVQHPRAGRAFACVAWPGYIGAVTGINDAGIAVFLHTGDSVGRAPRPGSHPMACAARGILQAAEADSAFTVGARLLGKSFPPRGYLTRVVGPSTGSRVFETDGNGVTHRADDVLCVVTNHFLSRSHGANGANGVNAARGRGGDSQRRFTELRDRLQVELTTADRVVSVAEAWAALAAVERGGRGFGTLHSLVFRQEPWVFELAIGVLDRSGAIQAAPSGGVRYRLSRTAVFARID